jgi:hypothetical protein
MVSLTALWLPILLSAVAVFAAYVAGLTLGAGAPYMSVTGGVFGWLWP